MRQETSFPAWYWPQGLHDAEVLEAAMQDGTLTLQLDSSNAMFDDSVEMITFFGARLKTKLPEPTKKQPVYWLSDELTALPFDQWKLSIKLERFDGRKKIVEPLIVIFSSAKTKRRGAPDEEETEGEVRDEL